MAAECSSEEGSEGGQGSPIKRGLSKVRFEAVFSEGKSVNTPNFRLSSLPGSGKVGIAVAKAIGSTPARNRQRRRVREALRKAEKAVSKKLDYVVSARPAAATVSLEDLAAQLAEALSALDKRWASE
jgi:ribonuclease P protein component